MKHFADMLTDKLIQWQIIKKEEHELYAYGFWQGSVFLFNFLTIFLIGFLFKMLWQSLIFITAYGVLRPVAGGYHARTQKNCYLLSILLIIIVLCLLRWFPWTSITCLLILILSGSIILLLAPVEDENKPLDQLEQIVYKHRTRVILAVLSILVFLFLLMGKVPIASVITISIFTSSIMLLFGQIINSSRKFDI